MEAIIAHPAKGAKRSPARKTAVKPAPATASPKNEAEVLQEAALQILMFMGSEIANADLDGLGNAKEIAIGVDGIVYSILNPDPADSHSFDVLDDLITIRHQLNTLSASLEGATGLRVAAAVFAAGLVLQADQYAERLHAAISCLPATLEDLRALTTFAGVRPFRDRPTPPIRRVGRSDDELKDTPVHEAGRTGKILALQCTWDISAVAEEVAKMGDWITEADSPATLEGLLRCYGLRIQALNGQVMAYLDGDGTTAGEMHKEIFKGTRPFRGEEE